MQERMLFVIGAPRSGTTMLQRLLGSHAQIYTRPEPHLITPLAHLGPFATVDKAPYDHINAAQAQLEFIADLPAGEQDYWDACRAYCDTLYGRMLSGPGAKRHFFLDKTPAYALVLPFLARVYPNARYLVLTRHPLAVLSSYANSFFEGDYEAALSFNDILGRYLPAIATFLRRDDVAKYHLRYEDLVSSPETHLEAVCHFLGIEYASEMVDYGRHQHVAGSYGDPKVKHHSRPSTSSLGLWARELASEPDKLELARRVVARLSEEDLATWGYTKTLLFEPVTEAAGLPPPASSKRWRWEPYRLQRKVFMALRKDIHQRPHGKLLGKAKYYIDVLLREQ